MEHELDEVRKAHEWFEDDEAVRRVCLEGEPCPTYCPHGCTVEADGTCEHGYDSYYKIVAMDWEWMID